MNTLYALNKNTFLSNYPRLRKENPLLFKSSQDWSVYPYAMSNTPIKINTEQWWKGADGRNPSGREKSNKYSSHGLRLLTFEPVRCTLN
jgi:hypothetical protein